MNKVRFGIIGIGNQGSSYVFNVFDKNLIEDGVLTALCDINQSKIDFVKGKTVNKDITYFTDYIELLDSGLVDAVIVAVPHYSHAEITIKALEAGINVICEKPAGVYTKQVEKMNEAAAKNKALFTMMFNQRTNCVYRKMKEMISSGELGRLQRVTWKITDWFRTQNYYDSGSWRATWKGEGGGVLINQCPHQLDLLQWIVGELPSSVRGFLKYGRWHDIEVEDEVTAYFEYANGATGVFITTTGEYPGANRLEISGTKGKLFCENNKLTFVKNDNDSSEMIKNATVPFSFPNTETIEVETDGKNPQHIGIIDNFAKAILGKEPLFIDGKEGINGVEFMNAIELSGWNDGEKINLPIDNTRYYKELYEHVKISRFKTGNDDSVNDTSNTY